MATPPLLYQVNTRILLNERARELGRPATLDDVPDAWIDGVAARGFGWLWLLGLWQTGSAGREVSRLHPGIREESLRVLPDLCEADIVGSPFAIRSYETHADFGGDAALGRLRGRLSARGLRLIADFVVNHVAPDHPWLDEHPEWLISGTAADLAEAPGNWTRRPAGPAGRETILAHGRDPYFPGWADTLQLNLRHPGCREALMEELVALSRKCDGLRCDMAMLAQADVFGKTWGDRALPSDSALPAGGAFWPEAIARVKAERPDFAFLAEAYWGREDSLLAEGFDYAYDKRLYDRLRDGEAPAVREHLRADAAFQDRCVRFLENHDEPRAAAAFPPDRHRAAALFTCLVPGLRLFHEGQFEGRQARASVHLGRRLMEPAREEWRRFYARLLGILARPEIREGGWSPAEPGPAWDGNPTTGNFLACVWNRLGLPGLFVVANFAPVQGQCRVRLDTAGFAAADLRFRDLLSDAYYVRKAKEVAGEGMYFDLPPWGHHAFEIL